MFGQICFKAYLNLIRNLQNKNFQKILEGIFEKLKKISADKFISN